eukprot:5055534-Amphidinium_carterae.1
MSEMMSANPPRSSSVMSGTQELAADTEVQADITAELEHCWNETDEGLDKLLAALLQLKVQISSGSKSVPDGVTIP